MRDRLVRTFGFRLAAWYFAAFVAGTALVLAAAYLLLDRSLAQRDREVITTTLARYAGAYQRGGLRGLDGAIAADRAAGRYEPLFVRVVTPDGAALHFSMPADWRHFDLTALEAPALIGSDGWGELQAAGSRERLAVLSRLVDRRTLFQVGRSTQLRDELLDRFRRVALLLWAAAAVLALVGGRLLASRALQPLRDLAATVSRLGGPQGGAARVPVHAVRDELDELAVLVNRMLDRIDHLVAGMRVSLDHVAHDLRTPVTRLRARAEAALRGAATADEQREALAGCVEECDRVMGMLDALMDLAEAEAGTMPLRRRAVDLAEIVRDAVELYAGAAEAKGVRLSAPVDTPLPTTGDQHRLAQAIANLIDNAVKYTPPGGTVTADVERSGDELVVRVADTGIGIEPHELGRIWDRLYRGDRSRSERGLGLGLSLVKAIAEAHGGRATADSTPGGGSRFELHLPAGPGT